MTDIREHLSSPPVLWLGPCSSFFLFFCVFILCVFPSKNDVRFVFTSSCFYRAHVLCTLLVSVFPIVVSNIYCIVFLICFSSSCVPYVVHLWLAIFVSSWPRSYGNWIYIYIWHQSLYHHKSCELDSHACRCVLDTIVCYCLSMPVLGSTNTRSLVLCTMFCRSLFVLLYFFFWPLCCLFFFDLRILITPVVSSSSS